MGIVLLNQQLGANFVASQPLQLVGDTLVLDMAVVVPAGPGVKVEFYLEYADGLDRVTGQAAPITNWIWSRECAEEDIGDGDVRMALVIRRFTPFGADAVLPAGTYNVSMQFRRTHGYARVQARGDTASLQVYAPYGDLPVG
jgi:hypothetical protein